MKRPQTIIVKPLLTEKSTRMTEERNVLTFEVAKDANKIEIRQAVEALFSVKVEAVRVLTRPGKIKKVGRSIGRAPDVRKAYVTLKPGEKPPAFFEGV